MNKKQTESPSKLKIIPLGGLEQIGLNITAFEYEDSIIVVDCGLSFPEDDMLGIDLVIPDISYLKNKLRLFTNNKTHMKGLAKALNGTFSGIAAKLNKNFSPITMREFVNCMEDCFENDQIKIISLLYFLNYVCTSEAKTNNDGE